MYRTILATILLVSITGCATSAARVFPVGASGGPRDGVYYNLPRTVLSVSVPVTRAETSFTPLGRCVAEVQSAASLNWELSGGNATLESRAQIAYGISIATKTHVASTEATLRVLVENLSKHHEAARQVTFAANNYLGTKRKCALMSLSDVYAWASGTKLPACYPDQNWPQNEIDQFLTALFPGAASGTPGVLKLGVEAAGTLASINKFRKPLGGGPLTFSAIQLMKDVNSAGGGVTAKEWFEIDGNWDQKQLGLSLRESKSFALDLAKADITSRAEPDPDEGYQVSLHGPAHEDRAVSIVLSELGLFEKGSSSATDTRPKQVAKAIELGGKVVGGILGTSAISKGSITLDDEEKAALDLVSSQMDDRCLAAIAIARQLIQLRKLRLVRHQMTDSDGLATLRGEGLKVELEQHHALAKELQGAFYSRSEATHTYTAEHTPTSVCGRPPSTTETVRFVLFQFSSTSGLKVERNPLRLPTNFRTDGGAQQILLDITIKGGDQVPARIAKAGHRRPRPPQYLYYRVPAVARCSLLLRETDPITSASAVKRVFSERLVSIAQAGIVGALPSRLAGSSLTYEVEFHKALGALKSVSLLTKATDISEALAAAGAAADTIGAAEAARLGRVQARRDGVVSPPTDAEVEIAELRADLDRLRLLNELDAERAKRPPPTDAPK